MNLNLSKKQQAQSKATSALSLFTSAVNKLKESIEISENLIAENSGKIKLLNEENVIMEELSQKNKKVIENISSLITG